MGDAEGTEERAEKVFFLSIEIDAERFDVLHGTEAGFPIFGFKVIVIVGNVSDKVDAPFRVGLITQIGLVVNKRRLVFAFGLKRTEQIAVGLVAQTVEPRQFLRAQSDVTARTQQAERDVSLGHGLLAQAGTQLLVGDVECRRHRLIDQRAHIVERVDITVQLMQELGSERLESRFERRQVGHRLTQRAQLTRVGGAVDDLGHQALDIEDAREVRGQLQAVDRIVHQLLDSVARHRRQALQGFSVDVLRLCARLLLTCDIHLLQHLAVFVEHHLQRLLTAWLTQHTHLCAVAEHGKTDDHRVGTHQVERELTLERRQRGPTLLYASHRSQFHRIHLLVGHTADQRKRLCRRAKCARQQY